MKFSKLTGCFYPENIGYAVDAIPDDAITVSNETFIAAMNRPVGTQFDVHRGVLVIAPAASLSIPQVKEKVWQCIKNERDLRMHGGGFKVGSVWFHSDTKSRSQQLGLALSGETLTQGLRWKTLDGLFIEMTPTLATEIVTASSVGDQAIFAAAEKHKAELEKSEEPENYDYSTGWPEMFQEN